MRILAFYPCLPFPLDRGAHYRGFHLLRELARSNEVDLLALSENGEGIAHRHLFLEFCRQVDIISFQHPAWPRVFPKRLFNPLPTTVAHWSLPAVRAALVKKMAGLPYDAVHVFDVVLAQYLLGHWLSIPVVADRTRVDLQYQLSVGRHLAQGSKARLLATENLVKLWLYERRVARRALLEIVCCQDDATFLHRCAICSSDVVVLPNGVDTDYFHPAAAPADSRARPPTLIFCGAMDYRPNVDGLRWYFSQIHGELRKKIPELRVLLVGKSPVPEVTGYGELPNVAVTGTVPDVRPFYRRAWLQIVPLRIGGGTRLKIVESMAMGTPVVSTTTGAQGLGLTHERDILLADSTEAFVNQTSRALLDTSLRRRLETAGLATVRSTLSWPTLGRTLGEVYSRRIADASGRQKSPA
jgi:glycosyltransferase involved in cell wall biosynthesis